MAVSKTKSRGSDRARLSKLQKHEWAHELKKLRQEFPRASRDRVLDALDTAYEQYARAPMRERIEEFARSLLREWLDRTPSRA